MKRNVLVILCSLIVILAAIIVAGVSYLYSGVSKDSASSADDDAVVRNEVAEEPSPAPVPSRDAEEEKTEEPSSAGKESSLEFAVTNCGTGRQNTIRQNPDNSLELIDEKGKSLWKMSLKGRIAGAVGQVDYYSNGKIQFIFCIGSQLHLVDRLGREVKGFPMALPYEVISGPARAEIKGKSYWRADTVNGPLYITVKDKQTKILTDIPK